MLALFLPEDSFLCREAGFNWDCSIQMTSPPRQLLSLMQQEFPDLKKLPSLWSPSYFVATTGKVNTEVVKRYIESQRNK